MREGENERETQREGEREGAPRRLFFLYSITVPWPPCPAATVHRSPAGVHRPHPGAQLRPWFPGPGAPRRLFFLYPATVHNLPQLFFLGQEMQRWFVIATNCTGKNSVLSFCDPLQVGRAINTNSPNDVSWWGFSDSLVKKKILYWLLFWK